MDRRPCWNDVDAGVRSNEEPRAAIPQGSHESPAVAHHHVAVRRRLAPHDLRNDRERRTVPRARSDGLRDEGRKTALVDGDPGPWAKRRFISGEMLDLVLAALERMLHRNAERDVPNDAYATRMGDR